MLTEAFTNLSPRLADGYRDLLDRYLGASPELAGPHRLYRDYALRDRHLPRPVLAYIGFHTHSDTVDFTDLDQLGEGRYLAQLLRDFLAIHDDIVDEDLDEFGAPPLPVELSHTGGTALTKLGKDLALYHADFLLGVDDLTGAFPGMIDHDKDTLGEITHLRRTIPLVLLAHGNPPEDIAAILTGPTPLEDTSAHRLRDYMWAGDVPTRALALGEEKIQDITTTLQHLTLGTVARKYLHDLVTHRLDWRASMSAGRSSRSSSAA